MTLLNKGGKISQECNKLGLNTGKNLTNLKFLDRKSRKSAGSLMMQPKLFPLAPSMKSVEGISFSYCNFSYVSYRRGKPESGDVDVILSNSKPRSTHNLCLELVKVLEERGIITHTLTISSATSNRQENPKYSFRQRGSLGSEYRAYGLDSLDKALVVFLLPDSNPHYTGIHRRVDLIIAPWRAWGTAIVGWTVHYPNHER